MPNRSKQKGDRAEREIVALLRSTGLDAYRVPLSGAANGFKSDVELRLNGEILKIESKVKAKGFAKIYKYLSAADIAVVKADYQQPIAIIDLERLANLIAQIPRNPTQIATDNTSQSQPGDTTPLDTQPMPSTKPIQRDLLDVTGAKINLPRMTTLRVASEEDLQRRDAELEADRKRFT